MSAAGFGGLEHVVMGDGGALIESGGAVGDAGDGGAFHSQLGGELNLLPTQQADSASGADLPTTWGGCRPLG